MPKRILIASDAWLPQINGVVRALTRTIDVMKGLGHEVSVISPDLFNSMACPVYPEIQLAFPNSKVVNDAIDPLALDHIHIATEGPVGLQVRRYCQKRKLKFTTSFHTMFPQYLQRLVWVPEDMTWPLVRWFHSAAQRTFVPTQSIIDILESRGFKNLKLWGRGIDLDLFHPRSRTYPDQDRPILMYIGRVSKEKNIEAFLNLSHPGTKYVVGDGPFRKHLEQKHPEAKFLGYKRGEDLASAYANADVFVFPSLTDTFGNVILEALASGAPVAAFPAPGPRDIVTAPELGCCHEDLDKAVEQALERGEPEACVRHAKTFTWEFSTEQFMSGLVNLA